MRRMMCSAVVAGLVIMMAGLVHGAESGRERLLMDSDWRFALGHAQDSKADFGFGDFWSFLAKQNFGKVVHGNRFKDSSWKSINLPHDWVMELPFAP